MRVEFNDNWMVKTDHSDWKKISIPHDAMLEGVRDAEAKGASASGFYPGGSYVYRREFNITAEELKLHYTLEFGGVYKNAEVMINGRNAGGCAYGYIPFQVNMDSFLVEGSNMITVKVDNSEQPDSRWYTGAGIYRPVFLRIQNEKRLIANQTRITTLDIDNPRLEIRTVHAGGTVKVKIIDPKSCEVIASGTGASIELEIKNAILWDHTNPFLYDVYVQLYDGEELIEEEVIPYGIRKVEKRADGLYVNNKKILLKGGCIHHDNGILGAEEYVESAERKIRILKENGFNAIRSAHNPCSEEILNACDKYGMYIMDETWDMWYRKKSAYDYANQFADHYKEDIHSIVEKDYNHPSVIMYSIGNEVSEPAEQKGIQLAEELVKLFKDEDPTRLVTAGFNLMIIANAAKGKQMYREEGGINSSQSKDMSNMNSTMFNIIASKTGSGMNKAANGKNADLAVSPVLDKLDIAGYNYASGRYKKDLKKHPNRLILGSETFPQDLSKNWKMVERLPNIIGDFMWTAWDYLGEAGIGAWSYENDAKGFAKPYPWLLADCGIFDILGNPTGEALWTKVIWESQDALEMAVRPCNHPKEKLVKAAWRGTNAIPSWSWRGCEGNKTIVEVYSNAYAVGLFLNHKKIGKRKIKNYKVEFPMKYESGVLAAIAYDKTGKALEKKELISGTGSVRPVIKCEKEIIHSGEICYFDISMRDDKGIVESNSDIELTVQVENGELLAFGSANPRTKECFTDGRYRTWYGRSMAVVKVKDKGMLRLTIKTEGNEITKEFPVE